MSTKYTTSISVRTGADTVTASFDNSEEGVATTDITLAASASNVNYKIGFDGDKVKAYVLTLTQNGTIKVNSSSSPATTITMLAGVPKIFYSQQAAGDNAFAGIVVTGLYITNSTATAATGQIRVLFDPTP